MRRCQFRDRHRFDDGNPQVVSKEATSTTINSVTPPGPITLGSSVVVSVSVAVLPPGSGTPSGNVTVTSIDAATSAMDTCTFTLPAATTCTLTPTTVGNKAITATYDGDNTFSTSTSSATTLSVTPPTRTITSTSGPNGTITPSTQYVVDGKRREFHGDARRRLHRAHEHDLSGRRRHVEQQHVHDARDLRRLHRDGDVQNRHRPH